MGAVWRAYDRRLRRDVAVKVLHPWIAEDAELRRRFAREARVLAPLEHEHIVRLYDYGEDGETPFLVMELIVGASLAEVVRGRVLAWDRGRRARRADRGRARLRARPRDRPSRPHARQRPDRARERARRRLGLRARPARPLLDQRHDAGDAARDAGVLVAGAGAGPRQRQCDRHVRLRLPALRAARGSDTVRRRRPAGRRFAPRPRGCALRSRRASPIRPRRPSRWSTGCSPATRRRAPRRWTCSSCSESSRR